MGGRREIASCAGCGTQTTPRARYVSTSAQRFGKRYFCLDCAPGAEEADRQARAGRKGRRGRKTAPTTLCAKAPPPGTRHHWQLVVGYDGVVYGSWGTCKHCGERRHYPSPQMGAWNDKFIEREVA